MQYAEHSPMIENPTHRSPRILLLGSPGIRTQSRFCRGRRNGSRNFGAELGYKPMPGEPGNRFTLFTTETTRESTAKGAAHQDLSTCCCRQDSTTLSGSQISSTLTAQDHRSPVTFTTKTTEENKEPTTVIKIQAPGCKEDSSTLGGSPAIIYSHGLRPSQFTQLGLFRQTRLQSAAPSSSSYSSPTPLPQALADLLAERSSAGFGHTATDTDYVNYGEVLELTANELAKV
ncbi:hypothetical protein GE09DRAFT_60098 [Coniochaeta sp. 2T2.1]|nr:hypothetical protein GE09DRAFT_60098 [Coniochaeta sp. 2T2.1]